MPFPIGPLGKGTPELLQSFFLEGVVVDDHGSRRLNVGQHLVNQIGARIAVSVLEKRPVVDRPVSTENVQAILERNRLPGRRALKSG